MNPDGLSRGLPVSGASEAGSAALSLFAVKKHLYRDLARVEYPADVLCTGEEREKRKAVKIVMSERRLKTIPDLSA